MSLSSETNKTIFNCTGGTTYSADFKIFEDADVEVVYVDTDGSETTLTLTTDYSISNKTDSGFTITTVSTYSDGTLVARRSQAQTQDIDYTQNDIFSTEVLEEQLDKFAMMIQELQEQVNRSILASVTQTSSFTLPTGEADKLIGWNSDGDGLENKTALDTDVQAACEAAQTAAETAQGLAETAQSAAESAAASIPTLDTSTDLDGASASDSKVPSQLAVKTYADTKISKTTAAEISAMTEKTPVVSADVLVVEDSASSYAKKKAQIGSIVSLAKLSSISDYANSATTGTAKAQTALKVCFGEVAITGSSSQAITNLPFTSSSSYSFVACFGSHQSATEAVEVVQDSASKVTIYNNDNAAQTINWIAIGT